MSDGGLKRSLRVFGAMLLTLSAVTPASSVFVIVPTVITQAGTGAFLAMLAGAALSVPTAFCLCRTVKRLSHRRRGIFHGRPHPGRGRRR